MFAVLYQFDILPDKKDQFIENWQLMTDLIHQFEGGLGSRLHYLDEATYIAYAQWPSLEKWENSGNNLPAEAEQIRAKMREACTKVTQLYHLQVVNDRLY